MLQNREILKHKPTFGLNQYRDAFGSLFKTFSPDINCDDRYGKKANVCLFSYLLSLSDSVLFPVHLMSTCARHYLFLCTARLGIFKYL